LNAPLSSLTTNMKNLCVIHITIDGDIKFCKTFRGKTAKEEAEKCFIKVAEKMADGEKFEPGELEQAIKDGMIEIYSDELYIREPNVFLPSGMLPEKEDS